MSNSKPSTAKEFSGARFRENSKKRISVRKQGFKHGSQSLAPGVGFEPTRPRKATGSQGLRIIHSAIPAYIVFVNRAYFIKFLFNVFDIILQYLNLGPLLQCGARF